MIELRKMKETDFSKYRQWALPNYAEEMIKAEGVLPEYAYKMAEDSFAKILPQGLKTPNQYFFSIVEKETSQSIGMIWFGKRKIGSQLQAFIYDFILNPEARGRGYGKLSMSLIEKEVKNVGLFSIGLHVFGHNKVAIELYQSVGYRATNLHMMKDLDK